MSERADESPSHLRWIADKIQGELDLQDGIQRTLERKAMISVGWVVAAAAIATRATAIFTGWSISDDWYGAVAALVLIVSALGLATVVVRGSTRMDADNYWQEKSEVWRGKSPAHATRTIIMALQEALCDRRSELEVKGTLALLTQGASVLTIVLMAIVLVRGG